MAQVDYTKEMIAYLKFWLGGVVVCDISLVGWLLSNAEIAPILKMYSAVVGIIFVSRIAYLAHKHIEYMISTLQE
ncbi:MAG: hypothetical protein ACI8WB_001785 [Phenylobacterium sp.]|jgi:hypothetical protein